MMERECGGELRLVKSWIRTGKFKGKGKGNIGRSSPCLAASLGDRGVLDMQPLKIHNVLLELFKVGRER